MFRSRRVVSNAALQLLNLAVLSTILGSASALALASASPARVVGIHHVCFSLNIYKQSKKEKFVQQRYNRIVLNCPTLCGEEWESSDVVWLGLRLNDQFDTGAGLEWLGEVALLAEGNDVVVKGRSVAVGDDGDSEGGVLAAVLGDAAGG